MIVGRDIVIRQIELGDEEYLYKWWNDGEFMGHATLSYGTLQSKDTIKAGIEREISNSELYPRNKRFIICKKNGMVPIGEMNYCDWDSRNQKCELGIKVCETSEQGKGYGKESLSLFIDFMFKFLNLNKIELTTMKDNYRAQKLYELLGFKTIGIVREGYFDSRAGEFSDVVYMDLLKREWHKLK
ncbi:GNAT family protein [Clostridium sp.]|uniref:GNAT family N-acetyltransferase n=1 Tax=Clostridium sp. TaxID=1506 RepID=UPI003217ECF2